jgi:predicted ATPase
VQQLRVRRMRVRGFKSLADFDLRFPDDLTILIGANGAGKSSVLQALAFVQYFAKGRPKGFFEDRGWTPVEVRSRVKTKLSHGIITFRLVLDSIGGEKIFWHFNYHITLERTVFESVWFLPQGQDIPEKLLSFSQKSKVRIGGQRIRGQTIPAIAPEGSLVSILDPDALGPQIGGVFTSLRAWGAGIFSLELLSPVAMRRGARGNPSDIGPRGERLGGFLASLSLAQKERLVGRLMPFYPLRNVETTRKRAGWVDLQVAEMFDGIGRTSAAHMSDGFMRLLGLASIPEFGETASTVLLDEVEDGIDPHILPRFIGMIARESKVQLIVTSHSPVLVNGFDPAQIAFVARRPDGRTVGAPFDSLKPLVEGLDYFGAGEVWANTDMNRIGDLVREAHEALPPEPDQTSTLDQVKAFMGLS